MLFLRDILKSSPVVCIKNSPICNGSGRPPWGALLFEGEIEIPQTPPTFPLLQQRSFFSKNIKDGRPYKETQEFSINSTID